MGRTLIQGLLESGCPVRLSGQDARRGVVVPQDVGEVRNLVGSQTDGSILDRAAIDAGMTTMLDDAVAKCRAGVTTVPETLRVTTVR